MEITTSYTTQSNIEKKQPQMENKIDNIFNEMLNNTKEEKSETQKLFDDIISLLKTGLTVSELEMLEELLRKVQEKIKEEVKERLKDNPTYGKYKKEIEELLNNVEKAIQELQKRISGSVEVKEDEEKGGTQNTIKGFEELNTDIADYIARIEDIVSDIKDLKQGNVKMGITSIKTNEELQLVEDLKNMYREKENENVI